MGILQSINSPTDLKKIPAAQIPALAKEVREFLSSDENGKIKEIADILEVLYAICDARGVSREEIEKIRAQKEKERGRFQKRIILEETSRK